MPHHPESDPVNKFSHRLTKLKLITVRILGGIVVIGVLFVVFDPGQAVHVYKMFFR